MRLCWFVDGAFPGAVNMRRDRALLARSEQHPTFDPVLRVYAWSPAAVSLGFHQDESFLDPDALRERRVELVRRPTGGAAVLHDEEITYAVTGPLGLPGLGRAVLSIHEGIAHALRTSLETLGVAAALGGGGRPEGFACFAAAGGHEITVGGRKLVGSALRRTRAAFLQHGSLLVGDAHLQLPRLLRERGAVEEEISDLRSRTCTLRQLGAGGVDPESFAREFAARLAHVIGAQAHRLEDAAVKGILEEGSLSEVQTEAGSESDALG